MAFGLKKLVENSCGYSPLPIGHEQADDASQAETQ